MEQKKYVPTTKKRSRMEKQELALVGLVRAGTARLRHVNLYLNAGCGEVEVKPFTFYKLDCPDPNLRRDGSVWPLPKGTGMASEKKFGSKRLIIPQEEIF